MTAHERAALAAAMDMIEDTADKHTFSVQHNPLGGFMINGYAVSGAQAVSALLDWLHNRRMDDGTD